MVCLQVLHLLLTLLPLFSVRLLRLGLFCFSLSASCRGESASTTSIRSTRALSLHFVDLLSDGLTVEALLILDGCLKRRDLLVLLGAFTTDFGRWLFA